METIIGKDVEVAANFLKKGKLVAIPTETVYGLAANALNKQAILAVFKAKNRPQFDPLIVHTNSLEKATEFAKIPAKLTLLAKSIWPGPLTILAPKSDKIDPLITSGSDLVAIRIPNHPLTLALLEQIDFPLVAPSANPFGYVSPTSAMHVANQMKEKVDYILDGGICNIGLESTIISENDGNLYIHRLGGLSIERIESIINEKVQLAIQNNSNPQAPGMLDKHYSPKTKLQIVADFIDLNLNENEAIIAFGNTPFPVQENVLNLSEKGDINEAAHNIFAVLRQLDEQSFTKAYIKLLPNIGLGLAINDRIKRAANQ